MPKREKKGQEEANINDLPIEILTEIYRYLAPEAAAKAIVNRATKKVQDNRFWQEKYKRHFPSSYKSIANQQDINWYAKFREQYKSEYKDLSSAESRLFSLVKEGNALTQEKITNSTLEKKDISGATLIDIANAFNNQAALNNFYLIKKQYITSSKKQKNKDKMTLYYAIICNQNIEEIKSLLNSDILNRGDLFGNPPLILAAAYNRPEILSYLLKQPDINLDVTTQGSVSHDGRNALHWAAEHGHNQVVEMLLKAGMTPLAVAGSMQFQPIHLAAQNGHLKVIETLLKHDPKLLNQVDLHGQTSLLWAASEGHPNVVEYLLKQPDINLNATTQGTVSQDGRNALHWAAKHGHDKVVEMLLKAGMSPLAVAGSMQFQPIHLAAQKGNLKVIETLINHDSQLLNQLDACRQTPLVWAASEGHSNVVEYLLKQPDINLNATTQGTASHDGRIALHWAAEHGHDIVVEILLKAGMSPFAVAGSMQFQPIHLAAQKGHLNVVETLINHDSRLLNQLDAYGQTPLIWAAAQGHLDTVKFLLDKSGVDLTATSIIPGSDQNGRNALNWAAEKGHSEIVNLLLRYGLRPNLTKEIDKSKLDKVTAAKLRLIEYVSARANQSVYKKSITIFGKTKNLGFSKEEKLKAAEALEDVALNGASKSTLDQYEKILKNGELGSIYQNLKIK